MPQVKDIVINYHFWKDSFPDLERILHFEHIRSFSIKKWLTTTHLNILKTNINLVELRINSYNDGYSQYLFDFICDNLTQLKSLSFNVVEMISVSKLVKLVNLEDLELRFYRIDRFMNRSNCLNETLKSLSLFVRAPIMIPPYNPMYVQLVQMFPNVQKISFEFHSFNCDHLYCYSYRYPSQCHSNASFINMFIDFLSKFNSLKVLEIIDLSCFRFNNVFRFSNTPLVDDYINIIFHLIQKLAQLCHTNTKLLCNLWIDDFDFNLITEKKIINGFEYNVFFDCEKFETNFGKKFEIPKNMRIIGFNGSPKYYDKKKCSL
jgi:hypothetical protein